MTYNYKNIKRLYDFSLFYDLHFLNYPMSIIKFKKLSGYTYSNSWKRINILKDKGMVDIKNDEIDGRNKIVSLTQKGEIVKNGVDIIISFMPFLTSSD